MYRILTKEGEERWVEDHKKSLFSKEGKFIGIEGVVFDVSERIHAQNELKREKTELNEALLKVKKLSGLLPICANCKKIRDDQGYWKQLEAYIQDHSEAEFSHSICPDCAKTLYPDLDIY